MMLVKQRDGYWKASAVQRNPFIKDANTMNKLVPQALLSYIIGAVILGLFLFVPAWTLNYWQAWVFIFVFTTCVNAIRVYLSIKDPVHLERRKNVGPAAEQNVAQRIIMSLAGETTEKGFVWE